MIISADKTRLPGHADFWLGEARLLHGTQTCSTAAFDHLLRLVAKLSMTVLQGICTSDFSFKLTLSE